MIKIRKIFSRLVTRSRSKESGATPAFGAEPRTGAVALLPLPQGGDMAVATVYRCATLLSESVATMPLLYRRRSREGILEDCGDRWMDYLLNVQPDRAVSAFDFRRGLVLELLLAGNAYVVPVYSELTQRLERLVLCTRWSVSHDLERDLYTVNDPQNGLVGTYTEEEIIHVKGMPGPLPKTGQSVLSYARTCIDIARTGDRETLNRFANGGDVRGIISNGHLVKGFGEYQDEELEKTAESLDWRFRAGERIVSLPGSDVAFQQLSLSSTDMQFLESRKFGVLEICRFFGVHPSFVFADTATNYKSAEQANMAFLSHTLAPLLRNIEGELQRKLLPRGLAGRYVFTFDHRSLHTCDLAGMADFYAKRLQTGSTVNEVRREQNLPPVAGGDKPMVSANLRSLDELTYPPLEENE